MSKPNTNPDRLKYKVYRVVTVKTGKVTRLAGVGMELPYEVLRNLPLACQWVTKKGDTLYERIM
tara:strand:+ start:617 stop:808 length:192 start_codon:yes stop_codon:yes gene_type:complete